MKRIVFIGISKWGLRALEVLHEMAELHVVGAITNPPVFKVSYRPEGVRNVNYADVASFCWFFIRVFIACLCLFLFFIV